MALIETKVPLDNDEKADIGRNIIRVLGWGMREIMRRRVRNYRASGDLLELKEAVTIPQNRRDKILNYVSKKGTAFVDECLALTGTNVTRAQINAYSIDMVAYTQDLYDRYQSGESADSIASDIESTIEDSNHKFEFSNGYTDLWSN